MTVVVDVATMPDHGGGNTGDAIGGASEARTFVFFLHKERFNGKVKERKQSSSGQLANPASQDDRDHAESRWTRKRKK
jgi:hypothetical protein